MLLASLWFLLLASLWFLLLASLWFLLLASLWFLLLASLWFLLLGSLSVAECRRLASARDADLAPPPSVSSTAPQVSMRRQRRPSSGDVPPRGLVRWRLASARDADLAPPPSVSSTAPQVSVRRRRRPSSGDVPRRGLVDAQRPCARVWRRWSCDLGHPDLLHCVVVWVRSAQ
ncbi:MAG: hypothetical protein AB7W59_24160 [Acidimicrobiia bacterium]